MTTYPTHLLRRSVRFFLIGLCPIFSLHAQNQTTATITGVISNAATHTNLEGAVVGVPELKRQVLSDNAGRYTIDDLAPGVYTLVVSYTGLDEMREALTVAEGERKEHNFELTAAIYHMEKFTVAGEREGNAVSVTKQKNADNLTNVVALDLYGNVADNNIGNFLKRLPGVAGVGEGGDITGLSIRGAPRSWNAIDVDGVRSSAAYSGTDKNVGRSIVTDQLSSEFIKEVELIKALRPDMPSDSVGGTVNLITKSALDFKDDRFSWRVGGTYNAYRPEIGKVYPSGGFTYLTRLGGDNPLGVALTGSYGKVRNARDRLQMGVASNGTNNQARTLDDDYTRLRSSAALKLNYRLRPDWEVWASIQYSYYSTQQERSDWNIQASSTNVADYSVVSRTQIEAGTTPRTSSNATAGIAPGATSSYTEFLNANFTNTKGALSRHARNAKFDVGADLKLEGEQSLKFVLSFNPSTYSFIFQRMAATRTGGFGVLFDASADPYFPSYIQTYGTTIGAGADLTKYKATLTYQDQYSKETVLNGNLDYTKKLRNVRWQTELKTGVSWRSLKHDLRVYTPVWDYVGADGVAGMNSSTGINDDNLAQFLNAEPGYGVFLNRYPQRDDFNYRAFWDYKEEHPGYFSPRASVSAAPQYNKVTEDVTAAYAMGTTHIGALTILAGARMEDTQVKALGTLSDSATTATSIERDGSYRVVNPSVHLKYEISKDFLARASYSTGLTRPDYSNMYPNTTVSYDSSTGLGTVTQNDPGLKPQYSTNYDVSLEYYLKPTGVISLGYFYKDVRDFIAQEVTEIGTGDDNGFDGDYAGFSLVSTHNYGKARIQGVEFNYLQLLNMLPSPFNTLTVNGNWTELNTQGYYGNNTAGNDELVEFIPRTVNAGLSWVLGRFTVRLQYNYQGTFLNSYNTDPNQRIYTTSNQTWDGGVLFNINRRFGLYLDVTNIFNREPAWYRGSDHNRIVMNEVFGTRWAAGITGRF